MKKKNPVITAVLNFFLPGLGFTYLGSPCFIATGIAFFALLFVARAIGTRGTPAVLRAVTQPGDVADIVVTVAIDLVLSAISWEVTNLYNAAQPKAAAR